MKSILISRTSTSPIVPVNTAKGSYAFMVVTTGGHILFSFRGYKTLSACAERYLEYQKTYILGINLKCRYQYAFLFNWILD